MYIKNSDLTLDHLQSSIASLGFTDVTASTRGYVLVLTKRNEVFGFHDLASARNFLRNEASIARKAQRDHEKLIFCEL